MNPNNNNMKTKLIRLKIQVSFKKQIYDKLINSNKLTSPIRIHTNILMIDQKDFEQVDKILYKNYINYKVL